MALLSDQDVAAVIADWAEHTVGDLEAVYDYPVASKLGGLPDLAVFVEESETVPSDAEFFPFSQLQGLWLEAFSVEASIMVGPGEDAEAAKANDRALKGYVAALVGSAQKDPTLGERLPTDPVAMVSPRISRTYTPPFRVYEDGTRGRLGVVSLRIGQLRDDQEELS